MSHVADGLMLPQAGRGLHNRLFVPPGPQESSRAKVVWSAPARGWAQVGSFITEVGALAGTQPTSLSSQPWEPRSTHVSP